MVKKKGGKVGAFIGKVASLSEPFPFFACGLALVGQPQSESRMSSSPVSDKMWYQIRSDDRLLFPHPSESLFASDHDPHRVLLRHPHPSCNPPSGYRPLRHRLADMSRSPSRKSGTATAIERT